MAEYWHMGETTMRLGKVRLRSLNGVNRVEAMATGAEDETMRLRKGFFDELPTRAFYFCASPVAGGRMPIMHLLDDTLALVPAGEDCFRGTGHAAYWNAFGPFGGWTAAVMLKSVLQHPQAKGEPLSLQVQFIAGLAQAPFDLLVRCVKQNRSTAFWQVQLVQAGLEGGAPVVCASAAVTLTQWRDTFTVADARMPTVSTPAQTALAPPRRHGSPPFLSRFEYRPVSGVFGAGANPSMDSWLWMRDAQARPMDALLLTCAADAPFPSIWLKLDTPVMITTVTFNVNFRVPQAAITACADQFVLLDSRCAAGQHGFYDQHTDIWSENGVLLAQTDQLAWFSEKQLVRQ
jgi:acyl-CoA thioesterase